ncbi:lipid A export permease/ATP-binding protein MsbA [Shumkonia mesophila]|uniref:lipid A export permease/ATP-binding protein MsbA n=1 Tax=Shumkonia mesophila TaxID=2838854 RepID=UPI002934AAA8|nr:lipid A export permease/ATP-binding protein MsbA [Shumkonia mesophila]
MNTAVENPRHQSTYALMRRLAREHMRPYLGRFALAVVFMAVMSASTAFQAWLMQPMVNEVFVARNANVLWLVAGAVVGAFLVKGIATYVQAAIMAGVGLSIIADLQNRLYAHLACMDLAFFHANQTGALISRFTNDINQMRTAVSNAITSVGKDVLTLIGLVFVMFYQNWELALISFFAFPVAIYPIARLGRRIRKVTANTQEETGLFMTLLEQTFQGIRVVKAYGMEDYEKSRIGRIVETIRGLQVRAERIRAFSSPIMETLGGLAIAVVIVYGGQQVIDEGKDPGSFFSFVAALVMAYEPMKRLANVNMSIQQGLAGAQRLFDLLDIEPEIRERPDAKLLAMAGGGIRLEGVRFSYGPRSPALNGVSIEVPAGKTVALVGPSGAGKSTILNLIPRFYDVNDGRVMIDGVDVRDVTFASLHAAIALVSQEVMLFDDTVRANIAYGRAGASEEDIVQAARHAAAHDFITALPEGYDTMVGEQGVKLSGGQRQRLAIARAMLKNAPILLLDEATSALDTESERQVQAALGLLMRGRTTLVIAHRLSTVVDADLIYVIDDGRIIEAGSHAELLAREGMYARLYALQFADQNGEDAAVAASA